MYRLTFIIICSLFLNVYSVAVTEGVWPGFGSGKLATINGVSYTEDDFRHWWEVHRNSEAQVPTDLEEFINWKLMVQEAVTMELDSDPALEQRLETYYNARTRMLLKYDAVDSKMEISDADVRKRYQDEYTPIYHLDLLYFDGIKAKTEAKKLKSGKIRIYEERFTFFLLAAFFLLVLEGLIMERKQRPSI